MSWEPRSTYCNRSNYGSNQSIQGRKKNQGRQRVSRVPENFGWTQYFSCRGAHNEADLVSSTEEHCSRLQCSRDIWNKGPFQSVFAVVVNYGIWSIVISCLSELVSVWWWSIWIMKFDNSRSMSRMSITSNLRYTPMFLFFFHSNDKWCSTKNTTDLARPLSRNCC